MPLHQLSAMPNQAGSRIQKSKQAQSWRSQVWSPREQGREPGPPRPSLLYYIRGVSFLWAEHFGTTVQKDRGRLEHKPVNLTHCLFLYGSQAKDISGLFLFLMFILFYVYWCFACMHVCGSCWIPWNFNYTQL